MDLPRSFTIREHSHRIHNPFTSEKLATLGQAASPAPGTAVLDLACGSGEMLCTWARDHQVTGTGVDISTVFLGSARARADELGVADRVAFVHGDASGYVASPAAGIAACLGATWIGGGVAGTVGLLRRSLAPGGMMLIGEPYWRREPPDQATVEGCHAPSRDEWRALPELIESFGALGCDVVEMVLADQDSWDRYAAAQWLNIRRWLDANPGDVSRPCANAALRASITCSRSASDASRRPRLAAIGSHGPIAIGTSPPRQCTKRVTRRWLPTGSARPGGRQDGWPGPRYVRLIQHASRAMPAATTGCICPAEPAC